MLVCFVPGVPASLLTNRWVRQSVASMWNRFSKFMKCKAPIHLMSTHGQRDLLNFDDFITQHKVEICQCLFMIHFLGISPVCPPQLCKTQLEPATTPQTYLLFPTPPHECHPTRFYGSVKMPRRPIANPLPAKVLIVVHLLVCKYHSWHSWYYPRCSPQWCNREKSSHPMGSMTVIVVSVVVL